MGLVIRRPQVKRDSYQLRIEVNQDHATGLLAQAKLGHARKSKPDFYRWGGLTEKQEELFPMRRGYYSLLLYRLAGAEKDDLKPFAWKVCNKQDKVVNVKEWLRSGTFPSEQPSPDLLKALFAGKIGTQESEVIKTIIEPNAPGSSMRFSGRTARNRPNIFSCSGSKRKELPPHPNTMGAMPLSPGD